MAQGEDCASVLDQFVQDVANLPAEICHLMEEVAAKDKQVQECRLAIAQRDNSLQKFIKQNGSLAPHPKEEQYNSQIIAYMEKSEALQDEKIILSEKANALIERHAKRLENEMRKLASEGALPPDAISSTRTTSNRSANPFFENFETFSNVRETPPLQVSTSLGNVMPALNVARRLVDGAGSLPSRQNPAASALLASSVPRNSAPASPAASHHPARGQRESSASAIEKRKGLTQRLSNIPSTGSGLRQSSLGPGTPKAGTPTGTRAGSAQPRAGIMKKSAKKLAPHQQIRQKLKGHKAAKRRHKGAHKASPSSMGDDEDSVLSDVDASDSENTSQVAGRHGSQEDEDQDDADDGGDDKKYCICNSVSYGNMIACDNENCPKEWFHWACVGLTKEPVGTWYCPDCSKKILRT